MISSLAVLMTLLAAAATVARDTEYCVNSNETVTMVLKHDGKMLTFSTTVSAERMSARSAPIVHGMYTVISDVAKVVWAGSLRDATIVDIRSGSIKNQKVKKRNEFASFSDPEDMTDDDVHRQIRALDDIKGLKEYGERGKPCGGRSPCSTVESTAAQDDKT